MPAHPGSDKSQDAGAQPPGGSSPPVESSEENLTQMSPQLPAYKRPRARSVQLSPSHKMSGSMNKAAATAALQRAIQSSPARLGATQEAPILVADLTPKPTRRILFPSPTQCEKARSNNSNLSPTSREMVLLEIQKARWNIATGRTTRMTRRIVHLLKPRLAF